jgi:hypothetical protein
MNFGQPPKPSSRTLRKGEIRKPQEFVPRFLMGDFKIRPALDSWRRIALSLTMPESARHWACCRQPLPKPATEGLPVIRPHPVANFSEATYGHSCGRGQSRVVFVAGQPKLDYKFAPKANRRPSQSFTTNSRECHGMLAGPRVNSTPRAAYSA